MLKMIFFDEDPDEVLKEEDISADFNSEVERIDFRDTEEVGTYSGCKGILFSPKRFYDMSPLHGMDSD